MKKCFRVQWNDPYDLEPRHQLPLADGQGQARRSGDRCHRARPRAAVAQLPRDEDEDEDERDDEEKVQFHNRIVAIIGAEEGLGVESLQGAGKIAAETSIANREIFTLGYSTARNIGIGSYVLRLGQRVIQHNDAPIILTGFQALNKLLGTNVYESNLQLGGPEVMGGNGVSHLLVDSDLDAVRRDRRVGRLRAARHRRAAAVPADRRPGRPRRRLATRRRHRRTTRGKLLTATATARGRGCSTTARSSRRSPTGRRPSSSAAAASAACPSA